MSSHSLDICCLACAIDPVDWNSPTNPEGQAPYVPNEVLDEAVHLDVGSSTGPESVALDANGRIYRRQRRSHHAFDDFASPRQFCDFAGGTLLAPLRPLAIYTSRMCRLD